MGKSLPLHSSSGIGGTKKTTSSVFAAFRRNWHFAFQECAAQQLWQLLPLLDELLHVLFVRLPVFRCLAKLTDQTEQTENTHVTTNH